MLREVPVDVNGSKVYPWCRTQKYLLSTWCLTLHQGRKFEGHTHQKFTQTRKTQRSEMSGRLTGE